MPILPVYLKAESLRSRPRKTFRVFGSIDRYLLRQVMGYLVAMTTVALLALLLERMLRLLELTQNSDRVIGYISQMLVNLIPHYLGIALPAAFFLAVYLTFGRLNRDRELSVMNSSGISLHRLLRPILVLGLFLTVVAALLFSVLQPYGRYSYRSLVHSIANASLSAAVREGTFIQYDGRTFMVAGATADGSRLRQIFVHERDGDGNTVITTASEGTLAETPGGERTLLFLEDGARAEITPEGVGRGVLTFDEFSWPIRDSSMVRFRERGNDERELTLFELLEAAKAPPEGASAAEIMAEFHSRIIRILSFLFLPLLAAPLALGGGRTGQNYGLLLGLLLLVVYEQLLQFGDAFVQNGRLHPLVGLWTPFTCYAAIALFFFFRACFTVNNDPLGGAGEWLSRQLTRATPRRQGAAR